VQKWGQVLSKCTTPALILSSKRVQLLSVANKLRKSLETLTRKREEYALQKNVIGRHLRDATVREYVRELHAMC
jgi:hypothetical protein